MCSSDLTSNILVGQDAFKILDGEAAGWGPTAYDLGTLFGNLLLNCTSLQVLDTVSLDDKIAYEDYLLQTLEGIFHQFVDTFSQAWDRHAQPEYQHVPGYKDDYLKMILLETAGYTGVMSFNRAYGPGMTYDFRRIRDEIGRASCRERV